jgi:chromosome segregation ATPase
MESLELILPYVVPMATLVIGYFAERGIRNAKSLKGKAEAKKIKSEAAKTKVQAESNKIQDMEKSLKFWVSASNEMNKKLLEVQEQMDSMESKFVQKIDELTQEKESIVEEKESLKVLILELRLERDEFKLLNGQLKDTIERQDAKITELEMFIQKQNMKISTLESKLEKYKANND